jgi:hypothetical protein
VSPLTPNSSAELKRNDRAYERSASAAVTAYRVLTVAAGMAGQIEVAQAALQAAPHCSPVFRSPGSQPSCHGSWTPTASIIWKAFAAQGWNNLA